MTRYSLSIGICLLLAACGDPLERVDKLSSVDLPAEMPTVEAVPSAAKETPEGGFFAGLFSRSDPATAPEPQAEQTEDAKQVVTPGPQTAAPARTGLFARLTNARARDRTEPNATQVASLAPVATFVPKETKTDTPKGMFSKKNRPHKGPDAQIVAFGTTLAPGLVARVCDLPSGRLGREAGKFPERGRGYTLYDSNPSSGGARPFYVTGFDDGCARTFTAAMAMFGSPTMHEQLRYGLPSSVQPYSTTDKAYEGIKRAICGVGQKKACGAKIGKLEKDTVFISVYDRIGSNAQWSNILLHKGWVLASDRKG